MMRQQKLVQPTPVDRLGHIKFTVETPAHLRCIDRETDTVAVHKGGLELVQFALGKGPCGRWVTSLEHSLDAVSVKVRQVSYSFDASLLLKERRALRGASYSKDISRSIEIGKILWEDCKVEEFIYLIADIRGRVHTTMAAGG